MNSTQSSSEAKPKGLLADVGEKRTDIEYWSDPWIYRTYMRLLYASCGALCVAWLFARYGGNATVQWIFGTIVFLIVLTYRWFHPNGFQIFNEAMQELSEGNYDGVPISMVPADKREEVEQDRQARNYYENEKQANRKMAALCLVIVIAIIILSFVLK